MTTEPISAATPLEDRSTVLVTGGLGFIGSAVVRALIANTNHVVVNLDKMSYASSLESVASVADSKRYSFVRCDLGDGPSVDAAFKAIEPDAVLISPGPGTPADAGISNDVIRHFAGRRPVLGVCLGHQCIGEVYGGTVVRAPELMHGKTSFLRHDNAGVFNELPTPLEATRYHSLIVERDTLPDELEITAETDQGLIMGLRHRELGVEGVQFHPESILSVAGKQLLTNWLSGQPAVGS